MNQVIIDNTLLFSAFLIAFFVSRSLKKRKASLLFSTFLLFSPLLVFLNMWAHTIAVAVANVRRMQLGTFQYNFVVYSLFLFGIVFIALSGFTIHSVKKYLRGELTERRNIFLLNLTTMFFFLPVGFINPLGFLPVLAALFSCILLLSDSRYRMKIQKRCVTTATDLAPEVQYIVST